MLYKFTDTKPALTYCIDLYFINYSGLGSLKVRDQARATKKSDRNKPRGERNREGGRGTWVQGRGQEGVGRAKKRWQRRVR
jgi:hypothetical protein